MSEADLARMTRDDMTDHITHLRRELAYALAEVNRLQGMIDGLTARVAEQCRLLGGRAEGRCPS